MENKFKIIKSYEHKIPGVKIGLDLLSKVNIIDNISANLNINVDKNQVKLRVNYFDFKSNKNYDYSLLDINYAISELYNDSIIYEKILLYNQLYWIFCEVYNKIYLKYNYKYNTIFNMHDFIKKFFHNLRKCRELEPDKDPLSFSIYNIVKEYRTLFFVNTVTVDEYKLFIVDFILDLCDTGIMKLDNNKFIITFDQIWSNDLSHLIMTSFDLPILGNNNVYDCFDLSDANLNTNLNQWHEKYISSNSDYENKNYINDLMISLVISTSVDCVSVPKDINNIFVENFKL